MKQKPKGPFISVWASYCANTSARPGVSSSLAMTSSVIPTGTGGGVGLGGDNGMIGTFLSISLARALWFSSPE